MALGLKDELHFCTLPELWEQRLDLLATHSKETFDISYSFFPETADSSRDNLRATLSTEPLHCVSLRAR